LKEISFNMEKRIAVVTGSHKDLGLELARKIAKVDEI
jgi:short-subunit dehydrogenase